MALPETIAVKYTEEEAEYVSVRPVVRQTFRIAELLDMLLSIAGKDVARLRQILRAGTAVFHSYRYWWQGFDAGEEDLRTALRIFPDADASRPFRVAECTAVFFESTGPPARVLADLPREMASGRRWFRRGSFWDWLMEWAASNGPSYQTYSYARRGDVYQLELTRESAAALMEEADRLATREVRAQLRLLRGANHVVFVCPRM